jgi:hypothetical protein
MTYTGYDKSAFKHGITQSEIEDVDSHYPWRTKEVAQGESKNGNPTATFVGVTLEGKIIEYSVEYLEEMDWVFHADIATTENIARFMCKVSNNNAKTNQSTIAKTET